MVRKTGPHYTISADDRAVVAAFNRLRTRMETHSRYVQQIGRLARNAFVAMGVGAGAALVQFGKFELKMARVKSLMGATEEEAGALERAARHMGATTQKSAGEAADALEFLALAGRSPTEAMEALPAVLSLSIGGLLDLGRASDIVTDAMSAMGIEAKDTIRIVDALAKAQSTSNTNIEQLGEAYVTALPAARRFGADIEEVTAALGLLANQGVKASTAGTHFGALITAMFKNADKLKEFNINVFDTDGALRSLADVLADVERATEGLTDAEAAQITNAFGRQAGVRTLTLLLNEGSEGLRNYTAEVRDSEGAAKALQDAMGDTLWGSVKRLTSALGETALIVGTETEPGLRDFVDSLTALITKLNTAEESTQKGVVAWGLLALRFTGIMAATAIAVRGLNAVIVAVAALRTAALLGAGAWRVYWGAALLGLPILVPLIYEAVRFIRKNWETLGEWLPQYTQGVGHMVVFAFQTMMVSLVKAFDAAFGAIAETAATAAHAVGLDTLAGKLYEVGAASAAAVEGMEDAAVARGVMAQDAFDRARQTWEDAAAATESIKDFTDRADAAAAKVANATGGAAPNPYNLGSGTGTDAGDGGGVEAPADTRRHFDIDAAPTAARRRGFDMSTLDALKDLRQQEREEAAQREEEERREAERKAEEQKRQNEWEEREAQRHQGRLTDNLRRGVEDRLRQSERGNKLLSALQKAQALRELILSMGTKPSEAFARTSAAYPWPLGGILGALHAASIVGQLAAGLSAVKGYNQGGIVTGYGVGDRVLARLTPGEYVAPTDLTDGLRALVARNTGDSGGDTETAPQEVVVNVQVGEASLARAVATIGGANR